MSTEPTSVEVHDAITRIIQHYVGGGRSGRSTEMPRAFHPDATIFGYVGDELFAGPIRILFDWTDENVPSTDVEVRIASIDVHGTVAAVRLEIDNGGGRRFTDLFTLRDIDGEWKMVSKVFHLHG